MIKRYAVFYGTVDRMDEFERRLTEEAVPLWRKIPQLREVELRFVRTRDDGAPEVPLIMYTVFDDVAAMHAGLASPERAASNAVASRIIAELFVGSAYHYVT